MPLVSHDAKDNVFSKMQKLTKTMSINMMQLIDRSYNVDFQNMLSNILNICSKRMVILKVIQTIRRTSQNPVPVNE
ncbi:unnamed protein product [Paramecium octaurelia]|uniref:Uncharacterized protein n=1 Tax=Paramecium octaurelia TaxID=43137 RepID=A0A8S1X9K6_PAROT|nr:unnamed protein product [Paramecium octaurelia]